MHGAVLEQGLGMAKCKQPYPNSGEVLSEIQMPATWNADTQPHRWAMPPFRQKKKKRKKKKETRNKNKEGSLKPYGVL